MTQKAVPEDPSSPMTERGGQVKVRRCRWWCIYVITPMFLLLLIVALILALTVFKAKAPKTELLSATLEGVSPRISFPVIDIQLNITLDLQLLVRNPNHASFKHAPGKTLILYRGNQVGEADVSSGLIPSRGSETLRCRLTIEVDEAASNIPALVKDVLGGSLAVETDTRIPGRVNFLGIFRKHAVATSHCQFNITVPAFKIQSQKCKNKTKF